MAPVEALGQSFSTTCPEEDPAAPAGSASKEEGCRGAEVELVRPRSFAASFAAVVVCGTINNFSYCIISGASQDLARQFHAENQTTVLTMTMNFSALVATMISTRILSRFRFYTRVRLVLAMTSVAYAGVALAASVGGGGGFALAALSSCLGGMAQIFGEVSNLAFLRSFPPQLVGGWGAGTGVAGILGSLVYMLLRGPLGLSSAGAFLVVVPLALPYWAAFHYLHREAVNGLDGPLLAKALGGAAAAGPSGQQPLHPPTSSAAPATLANIRAAIQASGSILFNLVAVYCLEYLVYPGLDDRETFCASKHWYTAMWMCYNVGVTMSRASVAMFRIRRVWLVTALQFANVVGWTVEVYTGTIRDSLPHEHGYYVMAGWMVVVGICGGAAYGNCMYLFNNQESIPENLRELGINLGFVMSHVGTTMATFSFILLNKTVMHASVLYPAGCPGHGLVA